MHFLFEFIVRAYHTTIPSLRNIIRKEIRKTLKEPPLRAYLTYDLDLSLTKTKLYFISFLTICHRNKKERKKCTVISYSIFSNLHPGAKLEDYWPSFPLSRFDTYTFIDFSRAGASRG